jgi:hypothetical protein
MQNRKDTFSPHCNYYKGFLAVQYFCQLASCFKFIKKSSVKLSRQNIIAGNVLRIGARCGTASRVRSAKIKFSREKQAQSQQNQAMALSKG